MISNERQRAAYLEAMGLSAFVPRFRLPGAKPSVQARLPVENSTRALTFKEKSQSGSAQPNRVADQPKQHAALNQNPERRLPSSLLVDSLVGEHALDRKSPSEEIKADTEAETSSSAEETLSSVPLMRPFSLSLWRPNPQWLILDQRDAAAALPTQQLLRNMLRAMGCLEPLAEPQVLHWPVGLKEAAPLQEAQAMLQGMLQGHLSSNAATHLWVMGAELQKVVLSDGLFEKKKPDQVAQIMALDHLGVLGLMLPSLTDLLRQPALKAAVWAVLSAHKQA